jgi:hypothetical protein
MLKSEAYLLSPQAQGVGFDLFAAVDARLGRGPVSSLPPSLPGPCPAVAKHYGATVAVCPPRLGNRKESLRRPRIAPGAGCFGEDHSTPVVPGGNAFAVIPVATDLKAFTCASR